MQRCVYYIFKVLDGIVQRLSAVILYAHFLLGFVVFFFFFFCLLDLSG